MTEPFLEDLHPAGQLAQTHRAIAYQPRNQHDRKTRSKAKHHRHQPVPRARQSKRDVDHRQEIDQTVGAEGDGKEDTEDERPEPTLLAIRIFEPTANTVIMLVVMMTAEE